MKISLWLVIFGGLLLGGCTIGPANQPTNNQLSEDSPGVEVADENSVTLPIVAVKNTLDLSGQQLTKIADSVFSQNNLEELNVANNNLTGAIPAEIRYLTKLRVLIANHNQMTGVPAEIGQLTYLEILDLSNNQLTGLPYELGNLQNLQTLNISGNQYSEQDLQIIMDKLPSTVQIIK